MDNQRGNKVAKKPLSFKDLMTVNYMPGMPDLIAYQAMKRKRGRHDTSGPIGEEAEIDEALTLAQRRKKSRQMKRLAPIIKRARDRAMKRTANREVILKRAEKAARKAVLKKITKGMDKSELSFARRQELEKRLDKMSPAIKRLSKKLIPKITKLDRERKK